MHLLFNFVNITSRVFCLQDETTVDKHPKKSFHFLNKYLEFIPQ